MTIHHDPSPLNVDESPSEEEEEEETDDELETDEEDEDGNMMTLQLVARLLGGNLMRRIKRRVNNPNMCHQPESERVKGKMKRYTFIHF